MKKTGSQYAIKASGGFQISNPTKTIHIHSIPNIAKYDVTNSLQIAFPANIINSLVLNDSIVITPEIFLDNLNINSFISFGIFENLYSKYESFIDENLGNMFSNSSLFSCQNKKFDKNTIYDLFTSKTIYNNEYINALNGNIKISDVSNTLQNISKMNIFGNRNSVNSDLFIPGDCFFMQNGISITLQTEIDIEPIYISLINSQECANRNISHWNEISEKTFTGNLFIYLI